MDLSLLSLVFSLILAVSSRLLHLYSIDDKTPRLMMRNFSTVRDTRRGSQSYMEKRRGRREIEVTRSRRGGIKRGESKLASNDFCWEPVRDIPLVTKVMRKEARHTQRQDRASGVPLDILEHLPPKTRVCLLYCFVLSPLTLLGAVPHHHLALSVKELTYSSN